MYKTILCAIEASQEGKKVLAKASELAKCYGSKLIVINVLPYTLLPKDYQKTLQDDISPKVEKITASFGIPLKNCLIKVGKPYEVICKVAGKKKADLIVIGTHSKKGLRAAIGSTATGVSNNAKCDVTLFRI
ncbi:MAG: universal stress protein A [SAR86 cluster bacterium]|uniref:Universal stress protein n=1 Tax=SAR86 cluster bacterium TaxID=2030880 RepID=A0A2A4WXS2_9GAMM|nr:MAG: universal stress protein A [SAR86 cluster bacterium]